MARLMSENEVEVCKRILSAICERPVSKMFWKEGTDLTNSDVIHPFSLSWIRDRLVRHKFSTPADFIRDLRICLTNGKNGSEPGSIRQAAAVQLLADLDMLVQKFQPSAYPAVLPLRFITSDFDERCGIPEHEDYKTVHTKEPISLALTPETNDMATLARDIKFLSSTDLIAKLAVFVRNCQAEGCIVDNGDISFNMELWTDETVQAVRGYVTNLLRKAASGEIDPFARPFGEQVSDIQIQQRGMYVMKSTV